MILFCPYKTISLYVGFIQLNTVVQLYLPPLFKH